MAFALSPVAADALPANSPSETTVRVFGESPQAGEPGKTYLVVAVESDRVVGGFYQPSSSFDCFQGQITDTAIALTVTDSYSQTAYPFTLAVDSREVATAQANVVHDWVPSGFYALPELSETDLQVLQACR